MPADASYVFDLISVVPERRELALERDAELVADFRRALASFNELWHQAGGSAKPRDVALVAAMDQARAAMSAATDRTLHGIVGKFISARSAGGPDDHRRLAPYAVLFLKWENAFPQQWRTARGSGGPWWLKKQVLRRLAAAGVPDECRRDVTALVMAAVGREHRCEDQGYPAVARALDGPELRAALAEAMTSEDPLVRLRAGWVSWVVDHPVAPVTAAGWRGWLRQDRAG